MHTFKRALWLSLLLGAVALAWLQPLDGLGTAYAEEGLKRALAAFAAARGLNAVISVIQGTEVTGGAFVNITLALGQVLNPVNDLIEQFSQLMLVVSVVFGVQLLLMKMGATVGLSVLLTALAVVWAGLVLRRGGAPPWLGRLLMAVLIVRFLVPVVAISSELSHRAFMAEPYVAGQKAIESSTAALGALGGGSGAAGPGTGAGTSWWDLREKLVGKIEELQADADRVVSHIVDLIVVFMVQTVVLPLLLVFAVGWGWRALAEPGRVT